MIIATFLLIIYFILAVKTLLINGYSSESKARFVTMVIIIVTTKINQPKILVVIPTLGKRIEYLRLALESIRAQKPTLYDIMMVFPLKNKQALELAQEFDAMVVNDPGGMSAALNAGISAAEPWHEYVVWMGDDDLLKPDSLNTSLVALSNDPKAVVAFGYCDYIDSNGEFIFSSHAGRLAPWLMTWGPNLVPMMGLMFRLSAFKDAGGFDTSYKWAMDLDLLLRLRKIGGFINTKKTLSSFRWHTSSLTVSNRQKVLIETEEIKRKYLSKASRRFAFLWEHPIRVATKLAVYRVNMTSRHLK